MAIGDRRAAIQREIRSPRSAALAGIAFAVLMLPIMSVVRTFTGAAPNEVTLEQLQTWTARARFVLGTAPSSVLR